MAQNPLPEWFLFFAGVFFWWYEGRIEKRSQDPMQRSAAPWIRKCAAITAICMLIVLVLHYTGH
jgi:hypothetical protein